MVGDFFFFFGGGGAGGGGGAWNPDQQLDVSISAQKSQ